MRYLRLLAVQARTSLLFSLQYRADFLFDGLLEVVRAVATLLPLVVILGGGRSLGGWTYDDALVVMGFFMLLRAFLHGALAPSVMAVVEHVRKGTLDFILLKPKDAQFLVTTARFHPWRAVNVLTSGVILVYALVHSGHIPSAGDVALSALLFVDAAVVLYALFLLTVCVAFYAVRVDNLAFLLDSVFDAARWPASVFRGFTRFVFTFVVPLALMTTFPAEALLGTLGAKSAVYATLAAVAFAAASRGAWLGSVRAYTSAGG